MNTDVKSLEIYLLGQDVPMAKQLLGDPDMNFNPVGHYVEKAAIKPGALTKLPKRQDRPGFILGKIKVFQPAGTDSSSPFVRIDSHPAFPEGLYISTYNHLDVKHHLGTRTMAERKGWKHIQMRDVGEAPVNALIAYYAEIRERRSEFPPLLVYRINNDVNPTEV